MSKTQKDGLAAGFNVQDFEAFKARKEAEKNGAGQGPGLGFHPEMLNAKPPASAPGLGFRPDASDTVDAALTPGEYVLPKDTVEQVGVKNLDALLEATKTPGRGFSGKEGSKFYFAGGSPGGVPDDELNPDGTKKPMKYVKGPAYKNPFEGRFSSPGFGGAGKRRMADDGQNEYAAIALAAYANARAAHQRVLSGEQRVADQGALDAARAANQTQGIALNNMTTGQRNTAADAYRNYVDSATGTGPGAYANAAQRMKPEDAAGLGANYDVMRKRTAAYAADPSLLAARNAREDLLGSGIRMGVDGKGQLNISNQGAPGIGFSAESAKPSAPTSAPGLGFGPGSVLSRMQQDPLASYERANAARQSMIDSQRGGVHILGGGGGGMDADRQALLRKTMTAHPGAQNGQLTAAQLNAARGIMSDAQGESIKQTEINQRAAEARQRGMIDQERLGIDTQRFGADQQRLSMDQAEHAGRMEDAGLVRQARQGLIDTAGSQDAAAKNAAQARAIAAGVLKPESQDSGLEQARMKAVTDLFGEYSKDQAMLKKEDRVPFDQWAAPAMEMMGAQQSRPASDPKQADGTLLKGKDGRTYKVVNGVPTPV